MNYNKTVLLPGGQSCIIRSAEAEDAECRPCASHTDLRRNSLSGPLRG
jgi:hypothetical protein